MLVLQVVVQVRLENYREALLHAGRCRGGGPEAAAGDGPGTVSGMARGRSVSVLVDRHDADGATRRPDELVVEEPMEIRLDGHLVTTTMRTPGHDYELAVGFCFSDGLLGGAPVRQVRYCATGTASETAFNVVTVETGGRAPEPSARLTTTTSSCGWCGTDLETLRSRLQPLVDAEPIDATVLLKVPDAALGTQDLFARTGAVHAAATFDRQGEIGLVREDIGRHNAVDKVVGRLLLDDALPARGQGLFVSGRASFEIVQKAWSAGLGTIVAVSAPSSLAVETAKVAGICLAGFARPGRVNVYT